jgi:HPr kinase/phosphorylase
MPPRVKTVASISNGKFFENHAEALGLTLQGERVGFDRPISESAMNRPGLALAGFFSYFAPKRVQVLGNSEMAYLRKLPEPMRLDRFRRMCDRDIPCIVVARGSTLEPALLAVANERQVPVFNTSMVTMIFLNTATIRLEHDFAPSVTLHGCMVDMRGVGVLITGKSGSGKSETAIGLLERGASLVADDMVRIKYVGGELTASSPDLSSMWPTSTASPRSARTSGSIWSSRCGRTWISTRWTASDSSRSPMKSSASTSPMWKSRWRPDATPRAW